MAIQLIYGVAVLLVIIALRTYFGTRRQNRVRTLWREAEAAIKREDLPAAETLLRECVAKMPLLLSARYTLGFVLARQQRLPEAEEQIRKAIEFEPKRSDGYLNLGVFLGTFFANRNEEALAAFQQAVALNPKTKTFLETSESLAELRKKPWFKQI